MSTTYEQWYENNYYRLTGSGIWLRGGEINTLSSSVWDQSLLKVMISRLSTSLDVSNSYTHKILYEIIGSCSETYVDMAFLPPPKDGQIFKEEGIPWLLGTSSKRAGGSFDVIAFSNSIVQELVNLPIMLEKSGIPLSKRERCEQENLPLLILGGANALFSTALAGDDPLVDGIFIGESAEKIRNIFTIIRDGKRKGLRKKDILGELEQVDGFFQPDSTRKVKKFTEYVLSAENLPSKMPMMTEGDQPGRVQIPISEGCPCFCSFCAEGWNRKPYREYAPDAIEKSALQMKSALGASEVELYSFNYSMHSGFYTILQRLSKVFSTVKVTSQRFDHIADDPGLLQFLHAIDKTSITCGLEGISPRLRHYLHKSIDERKLRSSLSILIRSPIRELKIFLIATGLENEEDYDEFREFLTMLNQMMQSSGRKPRIIFSLTPLVRFPFTPLESENAPQPKVLHEIVHQIERLVRCRNMEYRISAELNDYYLSQVLVRAQDQRVLKLFHEVCAKTGFIYYREVPDEFMKELRTTFELAGLSENELLKGIDRSNGVVHPVQIDVDDAFLKHSAEKVAQFDDSGYCLGSYEHEGQCQGCGACKDDEMRQKVIGQRERKQLSSEVFKKHLKERLYHQYSCSFLIDINHSKRGIPRVNIGAAIARAFMKIQPQLVPLYWKYAGSLLENRYETPWISGSDVITLLFGSDAQKLIEGDERIITSVNEELHGWCTIVKLWNDGLPLKYSFTFESPFNQTLSEYCRILQLKHTLVKKSVGVYDYAFVPQAIKKNVIASLKSIEENGQTTVLLEPGLKFNMGSFLSTAFNIPEEQDKVRVQIHAAIMS
jgi:radical SAM superfamily enzyme YgiQ (UPF0313 family)